MKITIAVLLLAVILFVSGCKDIYAPEISDMNQEELWQTYNEPVATDTDLILERQAVLNDKLDKILELLAANETISTHKKGWR